MDYFIIIWLINLFIFVIVVDCFMKLLIGCLFLGCYKDFDDLFFVCEFWDKVLFFKDSDNK